MGSVFIVVTWTARYLGPADLGIYSFTIAFVVLFAELGKLGLAGIVTHDLVEDPSNDRTTLGTAFVLRLFAASITVALLALLAHVCATL